MHPRKFISGIRQQVLSIFFALKLTRRLVVIAHNIMCSYGVDYSEPNGFSSQDYVSMLEFLMEFVGFAGILASFTIKCPAHNQAPADDIAAEHIVKNLHRNAGVSLLLRNGNSPFFFNQPNCEID
jgi:hypothetical protein